MWCRTVRNQLSAYADGELSLPVTRAVEEHLAQCERCAQEHTSLQRLVQVTGTIPMEEVPAELHSRILMRLAYAEVDPAPAARRPRRSMMSGPWAWVAFTGATAAIALGFTQGLSMPVQRTHTGT